MVYVYLKGLKVRRGISNLSDAINFEPLAVALKYRFFDETPTRFR